MKTALYASTALALICWTVPGFAQQPREDGPSQREQGAPQQKQEKQAPAQGGARSQGEPSGKAAPQSRERGAQERGEAESPKDSDRGGRAKSAEPGAGQPKGQAQEKSQTKAERKGDDQKAERERKDDKARADSKTGEPKAVKDAERQRQQGEQRAKGADKSDPTTKSKDAASTRDGPASAEGKGKADNSRDGARKDATRQSDGDNAKGNRNATSGKDGGRVQVTQEQRTNFQVVVQKERNLNRAKRVNFTINVGTRVPRTVKLAPLPASFIAIVPAYRSYRYVVVEDEIVIIEPRTYEIVEVIEVSKGPAVARTGGGGQRLTLTAQERDLVLREIELSSTSTLGLGVMQEGSIAPRNVELRVFPEIIIQRVPKMRDYRFFTAENRLAIVDRDDKVELVIEERR